MNGLEDEWTWLVAYPEDAFSYQQSINLFMICIIIVYYTKNNQIEMNVILNLKLTNQNDT